MTGLRRIACALLLAGTLPAFAQEAHRPVKLMDIAPQSVITQRQFFGLVVAKQTVDLSFQVNGELSTLSVRAGEEVKRGDVIAQLDLAPFQRRLNRAKVESDLAAGNAARSLRLRETNAISVAQAESREAEAELARLAMLDAEADLKEATITAPFDGIVARRLVENFTTVSPGVPIIRLHDRSEMRIEIHVPEILFRQRTENERIEFTARFSGIDQDIPLTFHEFNLEASSVGQTYQVTLLMKQPEGALIPPGASATVTARFFSDQSGVLLPANALRIAPDRNFFVLLFEPTTEETGTLREVAVTASPNDRGDGFWVEGLPDIGELVASGVNHLQDGEPVRRFSGFGD